MSRNSKDGASNDRMGRLANHILSQHSFYTLYPPAEGIPLDFSLAPEALSVSSIPDIIILPSDMKYFIKVLSLGGRNEGEEQKKCICVNPSLLVQVLSLGGRNEGEEQKKCICVNPGRLAKGNGGGTFAEFIYRGSPDMMNASIIGM